MGPAPPGQCREAARQGGENDQDAEAAEGEEDQAEPARPRELATGKFRPRVVKKIGTYERRPKHPKADDEAV